MQRSVSPKKHSGKICSRLAEFYSRRDSLRQFQQNEGRLSVRRLARRASGEFGGGRERGESGDGFDEAGHGEGVQDAAGFADQMQHATFASERYGHANQCGDAGAVDLRNAVEVDDHFTGAFFQGGVKCRGELVAGIADGEAAVDVKNVDARLFADVDFDGGVLGHMLCQGCKYNLFI